MKSNRFILFFSTFIIAASFFAASALAEGTSTSSGKIEFDIKGVTPPVDPEIPVNPQEPSEGNQTGQTGNLTLDVVPYPYFGRNPVPLVTTTYLSKIVRGESGNVTAGAQTFIQVSDARPFAADEEGSEGWNVSVKAEVFTNAANENNVINGARLIFLQGSVDGTMMSWPVVPVSYGKTLNCSLDYSQNEEKIFVSPRGGGIGVWVNRLYPSPWQSMSEGADNEYIQLYVPSGSGVAGGAEYVANLIWSMNDAP